MSGRELQTELLNRINQQLGGYGRTLGLVVTEATPTRVEVQLPIDEARHGQPHGVVHGGVYAGLVETVGSIGAWLASGRGESGIVGIENHCSLLRVARAGTLVATGFPLHVGRRTQSWQVEIRDQLQRLVAQGTLRVLCLEPGVAETLGTAEGRSLSG